MRRALQPEKISARESAGKSGETKAREFITILRCGAETGETDLGGETALNRQIKSGPMEEIGPYNGQMRWRTLRQDLSEKSRPTKAMLARVFALA